VPNGKVKDEAARNEQAYDGIDKKQTGGEMESRHRLLLAAACACAVDFAQVRPEPCVGAIAD
jgi:hypothetical protein